MSKSFSYFDGKQNRWFPDTQPLYDNLLEKVREVFDIKRYEHGGLNNLEVMDLLHNFLKCHSFKKDK